MNQYILVINKRTIFTSQQQLV